MFNHILNWRLLPGSHEFPGPDGGTCINEAAVVAAGFEYRTINDAEDCPPCFSRVIAEYTIRLNDSMPERLRQELLMPFVTRLAGTSDSQKKEIKRATHIAVQTVKRILPIVLRYIGLEDNARRCEEVVDLKTAKAEVTSATAAALAADGADNRAIAAARFITIFLSDAVADAAIDAAISAATAARAAAAAAGAVPAAERMDAAAKQKDVFTIAIAILDEAIRLGKQGEEIEIALVASRMKAIQQRLVVR